MKYTATMYKATGEVSSIKPVKGKLTYEQMRDVVGGNIEIVPLNNDKVLIVHEEGKLLHFARNENATRIWNAAYPTTTDYIVGHAIVASAALVR